MGSVRADPAGFLRRLFDAAVRRADPAAVVPPALPAPPKGRTVVVGAGKAAAAMARAVEDHWHGPLSGTVVTRYGHGLPCRRIEVIEAAHPVPDDQGPRAARRILDRLAGLGPDDLVLCLISGGASALLALPAEGIGLDDKRAVTRALLASGASIHQINGVRKHLSAIKGGRLALAAAPAPVVTLIISDVPGDDPAVIGSGPTVADPSTFAEARGVLEHYRIPLPRSVSLHLTRAVEETPKPGDSRLVRNLTRVVATPRDAIDAAAAEARAADVTPVVLGDAIEGEAREVARMMAGTVLNAARSGHPSPPAVFLSGGETTVTVRGKGRGGRNSEFLLALALALDGHPSLHALACDTDGSDGTEDNAGAVIAPDTLTRAAALGIDLTARLADNDAYGVFAALGDLVVTGPTRTNVNDVRAILVL